MPWDAFQHEALAELGHVVYRLATAEVAGDVAVAASPRSPSPAPAAALLPLQVALLRAAGRGTALDVSGFPAPRDARAKRALWPKIRALRAGGPQ